jgi:GT2 family glycosyltransferase
MPRIRFITVNFDNSHYSAKLLDSLRLQSGLGKEFEMDCVIVDNSTRSEEATRCREFSAGFPWVSYIRSDKNLGYFGGLNRGMAADGSRNADIIVIGNNDLEFESDFCERLIALIPDPSVFAICPDEITADGIHKNPHVRYRISSFRRFQMDIYFSHYYVARFLMFILRIVRPRKKSQPQPGGGCELHMGHGACFVLTPEFLKRFESLNFPHFLQGEEAYIADQIHSADGRLWYEPTLRVHHAENGAICTIPKRVNYEYSRSGYPHYRRLL